MNKIFLSITLCALCAASRNDAKPAQNAAPSRPAQMNPAAASAEPTAAEKAAIDRIAYKLKQRYNDLGVHDLITEALQEIADENRADFEVLLKFAGVQDQENAEGPFLPVGPVWFVVE